MKYSKPYLSVDDQINLLESRKLNISDRKQVSHYLSKVGYYRLSGYSYVFKNIKVEPDLSYKILDDFKDNVNFKDILKLYIFDKKLKLLLLDAIERIEIAIRVDISLVVGKTSTDPFDKKLFKDNFLKVKKGYERSGYDECLIKYERYFANSSEDFVKHFQGKYEGSKMPIWMAVELWDFGLLSKYLKGLKDEYLKDVCQKYEVNNFRSFTTWLHLMNVIRNISAHHSRLWNRSLPVTIIKSEELIKRYNLQNYQHQWNKVFISICIIEYLMQFISSNSKWIERVGDLMGEFPDSEYLSPGHMGFSENWKQHLMNVTK